LAGSFLLLIVFVLLAAASVAVFMLWRGAGTVRPEVRRLVDELVQYALRTEGMTKNTARAVIDPQLEIVGRWVRLKTTALALIGREPASREPPQA
jgi:hypothetical protein